MTPNQEWKALLRLATADGGPVARPTHSGTLDKLFWWHRYLEITTGALAGPSRRGKWPHRINYLDLFAGPGVLEVDGGRYPGSPMLAAHTPEPFDRMIFCEKDPALAAALSDRLTAWGAADRAEVLIGDCNDHVAALAGTLENEALSLAFIDPTGLQFRWESLVTLTEASKTDFLILIPDRMDIVRNLADLLKPGNSRLDDALGADSGWRTDMAALPNHSGANLCKAIAGVYQRRLRDELGFSHVAVETIRTHSGAGRALYSVLFASRNPLGLDFWNKSVQKPRQGPALF